MADKTPAAGSRPEQNVVDRIGALIDEQLAAGEMIPLEVDDLYCGCGDVWHGLPRNGCPGTPVAGEHSCVARQRAGDTTGPIIAVNLTSGCVEPVHLDMVGNTARQEPAILPWLSPQHRQGDLVDPADAEIPDIGHASPSSLIDQVHVELPEWILDCVTSRFSIYQTTTLEERFHGARERYGALLEYFSEQTVEAARRNAVLIATRDGWRMTFRPDGVVDVVHKPPTIEELLGPLLDDPRFSAAAAHYRDVLGRVPGQRWRFLIGGNA